MLNGWPDRLSPFGNLVPDVPCRIAKVRRGSQRLAKGSQRFAEVPTWLLATCWQLAGPQHVYVRGHDGMLGATPTVALMAAAMHMAVALAAAVAAGTAAAAAPKAAMVAVAVAAVVRAMQRPRTTREHLLSWEP